MDSTTTTTTTTTKSETKKRSCYERLIWAVDVWDPNWAVEMWKNTYGKSTRSGDPILYPFINGVSDISEKWGLLILKELFGSSRFIWMAPKWSSIQSRRFQTGHMRRYLPNQIILNFEQLWHGNFVSLVENNSDLKLQNWFHLKSRKFPKFPHGVELLEILFLWADPKELQPLDQCQVWCNHKPKGLGQHDQ